MLEDKKTGSEKREIDEMSLVRRTEAIEYALAFRFLIVYFLKINLMVVLIKQFFSC